MATKSLQLPMLSLLHCKRECISTKLPMHSFPPRESKSLGHIYCSAMEVATNSTAFTTTTRLTEEERMKKLKEFDETKAGIKGLLDSGLTKVPPIFVCPPEPTSYNNNLKVPVIDIEGFGGERRGEIIKKISEALETWGVFQLVNHGIPRNVMKTLLEKAREFHELPQEVKVELYSRDYFKSTKFYTTADMFVTKIAQWRDTLSSDFEVPVGYEGLPEVCGKAIEDYMKCLVNLINNVVSELMSEALGLDSKHLVNMGCFEGIRLACHYYPPCPEPHLTQGLMKHSDPYFLTVVLQDHIGGLQVLRENQWLDVPPVEGALVVNAGDFMQFITNDKFHSPEHRVIAREVGPRNSAVVFFMPTKANSNKPFGVIKEIVSEENPPKYRETSSYEFRTVFAQEGFGGESKARTLKHFQLQQC